MKGQGATVTRTLDKKISFVAVKGKVQREA